MFTLLSLIELFVVLCTALLKATMRLAAVMLFVLLVRNIIISNVHITRVDCGTYITDSTRGWIEITDSHNSRIATVTIDCAHGAIESIVMH